MGSVNSGDGVRRCISCRGNSMCKGKEVSTGHTHIIAGPSA